MIGKLKLAMEKAASDNFKALGKLKFSIERGNNELKQSIENGDKAASKEFQPVPKKRMKSRQKLCM